MTKKQIKALEAKAKAAQKEAKAKVEEAVLVARLNAQISAASNEKLIAARARQSMEVATTDKLKMLDEACASIVAEMPIYNAKTRENRKWNPSRQYGLGNHVALLTGILSGMQYSAADHKAQMVALTGLNEDLIESTLEAFGNTAYYSNNHGIVIDEVPYDLDAIQDSIMLLEETLDITLDKNRLTDTVLRSKFETARLKAIASKEESEVTAEVSGQAIAM